MRKRRARSNQPVAFSNYFHPQYEGTWPEFADSVLTRRKYPFSSEQYVRAFFQPFDPSIHLTPLRYTIIVEAIDTKGTSSKLDDVIARRAARRPLPCPYHGTRC